MQKEKDKVLTSPTLDEEIDISRESDEEKDYADKVREMISSRRVNSQEIIEDMQVLYRRLIIPLCCMISMPILKHALPMDIRKLEVYFVHGYRLRAQMFYMLMTNIEGKKTEVTEVVQAG